MQITHTIVLLLVMISGSIYAQISGNALDFDGENDHVVGNLPVLFNDIGSNDFTIEMWIKAENSGSCRLFSAQLDEDNFVAINLVEYVPQSPSLGGPLESYIIFNVFENSINHSIAAGSSFLGGIYNGVWSHVAVTWDASESRADVYLNGSLMNYGAGVFEADAGFDNKLTIGSRTDGEEVFKGQMDELVIWNIAKPACEIASNIYNAHVTSPNTAAYYSFNSGNPSGYNPGVNSVLDWATFNYATLSGFSLNGNSSNWVASGVETYGWLNDPWELILDGGVLKPSKPADMYRWIDCNTNSLIPDVFTMDFYPPSDDPNYSIQTGGIYSVILRQGYCNDTSDCFVYGTNSVSEESIVESLVYPNPSKGSFVVKLPVDAEEVSVLSPLGQLIMKKEVHGMSQIQFDLPDLNGIYFVRVSNRFTSHLMKVSIQQP